jgi:hypothetical protein
LKAQGLVRRDVLYKTQDAIDVLEIKRLIVKYLNERMPW